MAEIVQSDRANGNPGASISIIIACRNEAASIRSIIQSALDQAACEPEVVVADGMSTDGTRDTLDEIARSEPRIHVLDNPACMTPAGLNRAIGAAQGDVIVRMDAHTEYSRDYVSTCLSALQRTAADNVGGPARTKADTYLQKAVAAAYHSPFSVGGARFHDANYSGWVDTVTYGCWRREAFTRFGLFDEELVRNQDDEHNLRIVRGGGRIWQSSAIKSWYKPRASLKALFTQYMQYGYWKVRVIQKHQLPASWRHLVPGVFLLTLAALFLLSTVSFLVSISAGSVAPVMSVFSFQVSPLSLGLHHFCFLLSAFCFGSALSAYLLAVCVASVHTAARTEWKLLPVLPLVFPCYHFGYGYGFLRGVWDFIIRRKKPRPQFAALTR